MSLSSEELKKLTDSLRGMVGEEYVSTSIFERIRNGLDVYPYGAEKEKLPYAIVLPKTAEEIAGILRLANDYRVPVYVRGSGTSLAGASRYKYPGIVLNTHRMDALEFYEDYGYAECEPGCVCYDVMRAFEARGAFLPVAPGSKLIASMGGLVANNTSAHIIDASIGKFSDYILGVQAVLPTGEIIETGTKGLRRPAGTDLTKFFVGSDGLLGVVTRIRIRLVPAFYKAHGYAVYGSLDALARGVQRMYREKRPMPLYMEFMEKETARIGYEIKGMDPPEGSVIFFVATGITPQEAEGKLDLIIQSLEKEHPLEIRPISDLEEWEKLWSAREVIGSYIMQKNESQFSSAEIVSNLKDLPECMEDARTFNQGLPLLSQLRLYLFGHIGSLTMHPGVLIPKDWDDAKFKQAVVEKFNRETELNVKYGTCGGEWGQFAHRADFFRKRYGEIGYNLVKQFKAVVDPNNILNRGVFEGNLPTDF